MAYSWLPTSFPVDGNLWKWRVESYVLASIVCHTLFIHKKHITYSTYQSPT